MNAFVYERINNSNLTMIYGLSHCKIYDVEKSEIINFCSLLGMKPIVYILFNDITKQVYIGQTNSPCKRFKAHSKEKDWWNEAIIITAHNFTDSIIRFIEADLIALSKDANIYKFENAQNTPRPLVSGPDEHISKQFLNEIFNIFSIRRFNFFKNIKSSTEEVVEENKNLIVSNDIKIIIQPCGAKAKINFDNTIINKRDLSKYNLNYNQASVWGVHKEKYYDALTIGDNVYFGDTTGLFYRGKVCYKLIDEQMANDLWGNSEFKYIYILSSVEKTEIELSNFNEAVGYNPIAPIQSFRILDSMKSKMFIEAFGSIV